MLTFAGLLAMAGFLAGRTRLPAGAAPLAVLCGSMLWLSVFACLDRLFLGGLLWFAGAAAAAVWCAVKRKTFTKRKVLTPSVMVFLGASLVIIVLFAVRQPIFMEWDEFSFWGIAPKVVKETGRLYLLEPGELRSITFAPGLVMLAQLFQFLGAAFVPWKVYAAYDILMFAIYAAALAVLERRHWHLAVLGAGFAVLLPYLCTVYMRNIYVETIYISAYADVPMGLLFGAPLALYFTNRHKSPALLAAVCLAVAACCITKETSFALALIAAALVCFDLLFVQKKDAVPLAGRIGHIPARLGWCAALAASAVVPYVAWVLYRTPLLGTGASATDLGGDQQMSMFQMLFTGLCELVGIGRTERFGRVMGKMWQYYYSTSLSSFRVGGLFAEEGIGRYLNGSGLIITLLVLALLGLAFLAAGRGRRAGIGWFALLSTLGFAAYYIFIGFTYVYVFPESSEMTDYNRYIYPYYLGWLLTAAAILAASCRGVCARRAQESVSRAPLGAGPGQPGPLTAWKQAGALALAALTAFSCWRTATFVQPQLSVVDFPDSYYAGRRRDIAAHDRVKAALEEGERVFFVATGDDGGAWFKAYYDLFPEIHLDYSFGGGDIVRADDGTDLSYYDEQTGGYAYDAETGLYYNRPGTYGIPKDLSGEQAAYFLGRPFTADVLCRYLEATGCTAILIESVSDAFLQAYGHLFDDGLASGAALYRVEGTGADMHFSPIEEGGLRE